MRKLLKISGGTQNGQRVVSGVYRFCETVGLPLEIAAFELLQQNLLVDWCDYISSALLAGMKPCSVKSKVVLTSREIGLPLQPAHLQIIDNMIAKGTP